MMTFRSALVLTAVVSVVGVAACSTETGGSVPEVESATIEPSACPTPGGCFADPGDPILDPNAPDFSCKCGTPGPNGGYLVLKKDGTCVEQTKKCCPGMTYCPPSRFISVYNPCPSWQPYYRCNVYGDCWCSSYP